MDAVAMIKKSTKNPCGSSVTEWRVSGRPVVCRLWRKWSLCFHLDGGRLDVQILAIDKQGVAFLCEIESECVPLFEKILEMGAVYTIQNFKVAETKPFFRVIHDSRYYMKIDSSTLLKHVALAIPSILHYKFNLIPFSRLLILSKGNRNLCDVIGQMTVLSEVSDVAIKSGKVRSFKAQLKNLEGMSLNLTLWAHHSLEVIDNILDQHDRVCILTSMTVTRDCNGVTSISTTCASHLYATFGVQEIKEFHSRLLKPTVLPDINEEVQFTPSASELGSGTCLGKDTGGKLDSIERGKAVRRPSLHEVDGIALHVGSAAILHPPTRIYQKRNLGSITNRSQLAGDNSVRDGPSHLEPLHTHTIYPSITYFDSNELLGNEFHYLTTDNFSNSVQVWMLSGPLGDFRRLIFDIPVFNMLPIVSGGDLPKVQGLTFGMISKSFVDGDGWTQKLEHYLKSFTPDMLIVVGNPVTDDYEEMVCPFFKDVKIRSVDAMSTFSLWLYYNKSAVTITEKRMPYQNGVLVERLGTYYVC